MRKIYTRTGDEGMTGIHGGERVPKDDIRIEANGCLDELNTLLGIIRSMLPETDEWQEKLYFIQYSMMIVMSHVATPSAIRDRNPNELPQDLDKFCEDWMDVMMSQLEDNGYFILPGGTPLAAQLQNARAVARRAERRLWTLNRTDEVPGEILRFINRLSDLLFVMARFEMQRQQWPEEKWMKFSISSKKHYINDKEYSTITPFDACRYGQ